jgi:hypothetical protein
MGTVNPVITGTSTTGIPIISRCMSMTTIHVEVSITIHASAVAILAHITDV